MNQNSQIVFEVTETFEKTADTLISYFSMYHSEDDAISKIDDEILAFEKSKKTFPNSSAVSQELQNLGISDVRCSYRNGIKIFHTVEENPEYTKIILLFMLTDKQSVSKQRINHCIQL
jgi:hypothetical protein